MNFESLQEEISRSADEMKEDVFNLFYLKLFCKRLHEPTAEDIEVSNLIQSYESLIKKYALAKIEHHRLFKKIESMGGAYEMCARNPFPNYHLSRFNELEHWFREIKPQKLFLRQRLEEHLINYRKFHPHFPAY